ncbi:family 25 glycosyl hydrolase, partial [Lactococcus lactis]
NGLSEVYRLYNPNSGEHFYTQNFYEKNNLQNVGWRYEGIGWMTASSGQPVYRVYNPNARGGDHYYTLSKWEAQQLVNKGWHWDNNGAPAFYSNGSKNLYVAYNPNAVSGSHNYTTSSYEQNHLLKIGWIYGAIAWKVN